MRDRAPCRELLMKQSMICGVTSMLGSSPLASFVENCIERSQLPMPGKTVVPCKRNELSLNRACSRERLAAVVNCCSGESVASLRTTPSADGLMTTGSPLLIASDGILDLLSQLAGVHTRAIPLLDLPCPWLTSLTPNCGRSADERKRSSTHTPAYSHEPRMNPRWWAWLFLASAL